MEWLETEDCLDRPSHVLPARIRRSNGSTNEIEVLDVSLAGCMIERRALFLTEGDRVLLRLADLSFMAATVIWVEEQEAGLVFETELYEPVLEHLKRSFVRRGR
jgi:PilZ domain